MAAAPALIDAPPLSRYGGVPTVEYGTSPAAGAGFVYAVASQYYLRLLTVFFRFVTSADVADRSVFIEYRDASGNRYALAGAPVVQAASTTTDYAFQVWLGQPDWPIDSTVLVPLPPLLLPPTHDFRIFASNAAATDAITRVRFVPERFFTADPG